jgi:hypothetical protein
MDRRDRRAFAAFLWLAAGVVLVWYWDWTLGLLEGVLELFMRWISGEA